MIFMYMNMMQNSIILFTRNVLTDFAYYLWQDPIESYPAEIDVPGYGPITSKLTPEERTHDFFEHQLEVEPYSMQFQTPEERKGKLLATIEQIIMPAMPMLQQQGISIDWATLIKLVAEYDQMPELESVIDVKGAPMDAGTAPPQKQQGAPGQQGPPGAPSPGQGATPGMPARTHRTYERVSQPGRSNRQQQEAMLVQHLMGGRVQPSEMAGAVGA